MSDLPARTAAQGGPEALAMHTLGGTVLNASAASHVIMRWCTLKPINITLE